MQINPKIEYSTLIQKETRLWESWQNYDIEMEKLDSPLCEEAGCELVFRYLFLNVNQLFVDYK